MFENQSIFAEVKAYKKLCQFFWASLYNKGYTIPFPNNNWMARERNGYVWCDMQGKNWLMVLASEKYLLTLLTLLRILEHGVFLYDEK